MSNLKDQKEKARKEFKEWVRYNNVTEVNRFLDTIVEEAYKARDMEIVTLKSDIAHAIGYCRGLGKPESYLEKKYGDWLNSLTSKE